MNTPNSSNKGAQRKKNIGAFGGLCVREKGEENQPIELVNLTHDKFPHLVTRGSRTQKSQTVTSPKALFPWDELVYVDGTTLYYDGVAVSGSLSSATPKQFAVVNTKLCIFPDKAYVDLTEQTMQIRDLAATAPVVSVSYPQLGDNDIRMYCVNAPNMSAFSVGETIKMSCASVPFNHGKLGTIREIRQYSSSPVSYEIVLRAAGILPFVLYKSITTLAANTHYYFTADSYSYCHFVLDNAVAASNSELYLLAWHKKVMIADKTGRILQTAECAWIDSATTPSGSIIYGGQYQGSVTLSRNVPNMDYICSSGNRLWGVSNEVENTLYDAEGNPYTYKGRCIYASALGDPKSFYQYIGISTDSYALGVASKGDFTGIAAYSDDVLCFKEHEMLRMIGSEPSAFYMYQYDIPGVKDGCFKSLQSINEILYYLSEDGVYTYSGSVPRLLSYDAMDAPMRKAVSASDGRRYYLSGKVGNEYRNMVYDTLLGVWTRYGNDEYKDMCFFDGEILGLMSDKLVAFGDGDTETFNWSVVFRPMDEDIMERKEYQRIRLRMDTPANTTVSVTVWMGNIQSATSIQHPAGVWTYLFKLPYNRSDRIQFQLNGSGKARLLDIQREYYICSEDG